MKSHLSPVSQDMTIEQQVTAKRESDHIDGIVDLLFLYLQQEHGDLVKAPSANIIDISSTTKNKKNKAA